MKNPQWRFNFCTKSIHCIVREEINRQILEKLALLADVQINEASIYVNQKRGTLLTTPFQPLFFSCCEWNALFPRRKARGKFIVPRTPTREFVLPDSESPRSIFPAVSYLKNTKNAASSYLKRIKFTLDDAMSRFLPSSLFFSFLFFYRDISDRVSGKYQLYTYYCV